MTLPSLVSFPRPHTTPAVEWKISQGAIHTRAACGHSMANTNGTAEVEQTPTKDVPTDGQTEGTEEHGAGQQPDSMSLGSLHEQADGLTCSRHLPCHHQAAS